MRLVWVPQWTVMPVIVEDRAVVDDNAQRAGMSSAGQALNASFQDKQDDHNDSSAACKTSH